VRGGLCFWNLRGRRVPPTEHDADHWLELAEEARHQAERMTDPDRKREMLAIAAAYQRLADQAAGKKERRE
jgi:predicted nucleic acid-binding protein